MKNIHSFIIMAAFIPVLAACGAGTGETPASDSGNATQAIVNTGGAAGDSGENITGSRLIASNDCLGCHTIHEKNFGPSYMQIAKQYDYNEGNIENLAHRIIKGGRGLWGQNAMPPHPTISFPEAKAMSRYILSLNIADTSR